MNIGNLASELRKEFQKKVDDMLVQELRQQELSQEEIAALSKELPGLVIPKLSVKETGRARELIDKLDGHVSQLAELTVNIGKTASDYRATITELTGLLANKEHDLSYRHTPSKIKFMLSTIATILQNDITNAVAGFRGLPGKEYIEGKLNKYAGI